MTRIFMTGASGYIGGDFLYVAVAAHPEWEISCLVRDRAKASKITSTFPRVRVVHGDLDATALIEEEAARAEIVYHFANCDHVKSARAIARGLARNVHRAAFWIHTSGAGILTHENFALNTFGHATPGRDKVYDDWDHVGDLTSLPDRALHRHVDKIVLAASSSDPDRIRTAIVCPPCIHGVGRGTGNASSVQVHVAAQVSLAAGQGLQMGDGSDIWHDVHVHDLSDLYLLLGEAATRGGAPATWNERGYYLAENGVFTWGGVAERIADTAWRQGYLDSPHVKGVEAAEAQTHHKNFQYLCGTTSRGVSQRARVLLGWTPSRVSMMDRIPEIVREEADRLGLTPKKPSAKL